MFRPAVRALPGSIDAVSFVETMPLERAVAIAHVAIWIGTGHDLAGFGRAWSLDREEPASYA
jgi:hypothetical protein